MIYKRYKKELEYSYTFGMFPTIELLTYKSDCVHEVIYSDKALKSNGFTKLIELCHIKKVVLKENSNLVHKLIEKENIYVVGIFSKFTTRLKVGSDHVLLFKPSDDGNLGNIIRSSVGLFRPNIGIISGNIDVFNPKVIRASMGSIFQCNIEYCDRLNEYIDKYNNQIYSFDIKGQQYLSTLEPKYPNSYLFGNEGDGLPDEILEITSSIKIEYDSSKIDSLNLGNSVSIALYDAYLKLAKGN